MAEISMEKMAQNVIQVLKDNGVFIGRWIPVSERLPEDFQRVLVTIVNYNGNRIVRVAEYYKWEGAKGTFHIKENHERWEIGEKGLLAWMPLPEPYKAESEDT